MKKKFFLDNLAVFPMYSYICQRACFNIKGPAVSLEGFIVMADDSELSDFQGLIKESLAFGDSLALFFLTFQGLQRPRNLLVRL